MRKKLFVSHSSKTPENVRLLKQVCAGLARSPDYEPLWDQSGDLEPGGDWSRRLDEWMAECHAAVILFSRAALDESLWVRKEAAILAWRRELEPDFTLVPVLLDGLKAEDLNEGPYGVSRISRSQCLRDCQTGRQIVDGVLAALRRRASPFPRTPFERIENVIADLLEAHVRQRASPDVLEHAWNSLPDNERPPWRKDRGERFAAALTRYLLRDRRRALSHLHRVLNTVRPVVDRESELELLKYLGCLWVDSAAARGIPQARRDSGTVALNGAYPVEFTALRYGERAWPLDDCWTPIHVSETSRNRDELLADIRAGISGARQLPEPILNGRLRQPDNPVLVIIPPSQDGQLPDADLLAGLRAEYSGLLFVVSAGPRLPKPLPPSFRGLVPELDLHVEEQQYVDYSNVQTLIDNQHPDHRL